MSRLIIFLGLFCFGWTLTTFAEPADSSTAISDHIRRVTEQVDRLERLQHGTRGELGYEIRNLRITWAAYVQADRRMRECFASQHITLGRAYYRH